MRTIRNTTCIESCNEYLIVTYDDWETTTERVVDTSSISDLTTLMRMICGKDYDKFWHDQLYVLKGVWRKWYEAPFEEWDNTMVDQNTVADIYLRQIDF